MNVSHLCYVYLSQVRVPGGSLPFIHGVLVRIEKFGYSFGFVGNMLYMMLHIGRAIQDDALRVRDRVDEHGLVADPDDQWPARRLPRVARASSCSLYLIASI